MSVERPTKTLEDARFDIELAPEHVKQFLQLAYFIAESIPDVSIMQSAFMVPRIAAALHPDVNGWLVANKYISARDAYAIGSGVIRALTAAQQSDLR